MCIKAASAISVARLVDRVLRGSKHAGFESRPVVLSKASVNFPTNPLHLRTGMKSSSNKPADWNDKTQHKCHFNE